MNIVLQSQQVYVRFFLKKIKIYLCKLLFSNRKKIKVENSSCCSWKNDQMKIMEKSAVFSGRSMAKVISIGKIVVSEPELFYEKKKKICSFKWSFLIKLWRVKKSSHCLRKRPTKVHQHFFDRMGPKLRVVAKSHQKYNRKQSASEFWGLSGWCLRLCVSVRQRRNSVAKFL